MRTGSGELRGITTVLGFEPDATRELGYSDNSARALPVWAAILSLTSLRRWRRIRRLRKQRTCMGLSGKLRPKGVPAE
jgi:hypothetical protein